MDKSTTYWNHNGKYQELSTLLEKLIPEEGSVKNPSKNKCLERFRKASNCYHDFYNNGLGNMARTAYRVFPLSCVWEVRQLNADVSRGTRDMCWDRVGTEIEARMNEIVLAAAIEQKIEGVEKYLNKTENSSVLSQ